MPYTYRSIAAAFQLLYSAEYCKTPEDRRNIFVHFPMPKDLTPCDYFTRAAYAADVLTELSDDSLYKTPAIPDNKRDQQPSANISDKIIPQKIENLVSGVMESIKELDREIESNLLKWNINRLGICELIILRMAYYLFIKEMIPPERIIKYIKKLTAQFGLEKAKSLLIQTFISMVNKSKAG